MTKRRIRWAVAVPLLGMLGYAGNASAQSQGFALDRFDPTPAGDLFFGVQNPGVDGRLRVNFAAVADYAHAPLVVRNGNDEVGKLISKQGYIHVGASIAILDRLLIHASLPVAFVNQGDSPAGFKSPDAATSGDFRFGGRFAVVGKVTDPFQLAISAKVFLPTGQQDGFAGEGKSRFAPELLLGGIVSEMLAWNVNLGMMFRRGNTLLGTSVTNEFTFGAAVGFLAAKKTFLIGPELYGSTEVAGDANAFGKHYTNAELLMTVKYRPSPIQIGIGAGPGLTTGLGTPDFRIVGTLQYAAWGEEPPPPPKPQDGDGDGILDRDDACPAVAGVKNADPLKNGCPAEQPDGDKDGIFDLDDACPAVAGVKDADPKKNGCPPDKDADGIVDADDACIDVAGVKNDDPKKNGCPPDKDADGIVDAEDACIDVPGVKDADPKKNGCPPDKDGDGILDASDACPDQAGPADPDPTKNGCPLVKLTAKAIEITEQVHFETGKAAILPDSSKLLDAIAQVLKDHPEIKKLSIDGHTDNKGAAGFNTKLSKDRAESVVKWLIAHGVDKARLVSKGFGSTKPIGDNKTEEGRAKNRRVELNILEQTKPEAKPDAKADVKLEKSP